MYMIVKVIDYTICIIDNRCIVNIIFRGPLFKKIVRSGRYTTTRLYYVTLFRCTSRSRCGHPSAVVLTRAVNLCVNNYKYYCRGVS